ncbi:ABC transporter permease [Micromonospora zamorensis]|uniref:ABC transporter permease n=1 Tax=Micromonospora zamorensis TaxID=709883 RepID=UPI00340F65F8
MTAPTVARPLADLMPAARDLAETVGGIPSRNRIMSTLRVGAPKATALRDALIAEAAEAASVPDPWVFAEPTDVPAPVSPAPTGSAGFAQVPAAGSAGSAGMPAPAPPVPASGLTESDRVSPSAPAPVPVTPPVEASPQVAADGHPGISAASRRPRRVSTWPLVLIGLPAFVAIWAGWVGLGGLTGFGVVHPLPGIADGFSINTAITLPIGVEVYAAYSLRAWLSGSAPARARRFAKWSGVGSLVVGAAGQVAYHLLVAAGISAAPWWITTAVACLPVAVLGMAAALAHLMHED